MGHNRKGDSRGGGENGGLHREQGRATLEALDDQVCAMNGCVPLKGGDSPLVEKALGGGRKQVKCHWQLVRIRRPTWHAITTKNSFKDFSKGGT